MLDRLNHDNCVVNDEADGKHERKERERIDRETEQRKYRECTDQRNRHCNHRNKRGPPILQKDEDDQDDQHNRNQERLYYLSNALSHRTRCVERDRVIEIIGKTSLELGHGSLHAVGHRQSIRARSLKHSDDAGRLTFESRNLLVVEGAEFDARDIPEPHHRAVRI